MLKSLAYSSVAALAYTYVGYPVLIELLSRSAAHPPRIDHSYTPKVSVLIPVYNAKRYVEAKIESLLAQDYPADLVEILMYSDCSDDGSDEIVERYADRGVRLLRGTERKGKPTALNVMRKEATGDVFIMTDIRQPLSPNVFRDLTARLADPRVGTVSGNLTLVGGTGAGFYWHYENRIRRAEARFRSMIGVTGPLYAIRRDDFPETVPEDIILDDMWIPLQLRMSGKRLELCEEAIAYDEAFADEREFGRKVRTLAGNFQLFSRMPELLSPAANPIWFETMSHKIMRLAGPALLATSLGASVAELARKPSDKTLRLLVAGQLGFWGLAALGDKAGKLGTTARTFAVMNWAAVQGGLRHLRGSQKITW